MESRSAATGEPACHPSGLRRAEAEAKVGLTINGKWRLDALLAVGDTTSVYAATHRRGSRAALKILHPELSHDDGVRDRLLRQGYVASKIEHRGRVAVHDDDLTETGEPFLILELLEGETVHQLWKRRGGSVPVAEALWIAAELLDALNSFHAQDIVLRNVEPASVFITKEGVVKLFNFGDALMRGDRGGTTRAGTTVGTLNFMAPEQAVNGRVDGRADLFSVGASLHAMLSGKLLYDGRTEDEAFLLAVTTPTPSLAVVAPDLPVEVIGLVDRALARDPGDRFETAAVMRDACLRLIEALGVDPQRSADEPPPSAGPVGASSIRR